MSDVTTIFRAIADFRSVGREARETRQEIRKLREEEAALNASSASSSARSERASRSETSTLRNEAGARKNNNRSLVEQAREALRAARSLDHYNSKHRDSINILQRAERSHNGFVRALGRDAGALTAAASTLQNFLSKIAQVGEESESAGGGIGSLGGAISKVSGFAASAVPMLAKLSAYLAAASAIEPLIAGFASLGGAALGLASSLGSLLGVLAALPSAFAAAATGVGALMTAFSGVGDIFSLYSKQQKAIQTASSDTASTEVKNALAVRQAMAGLADARLMAVRNVQDALERIKDAERSYAEAQYGVKTAQEALTQAREEARQTLARLREEVANASNYEFNAQADLVSAKERYAQLLQDPNATSGDRLQALAAINQAEQALKDTRKQNKQNAKDLADAEKKGIEGSDAVISARFALRDAIDAQHDAQVELNRATQDYPRAQRDASLAIAQAQQALKDAQKTQASGSSAVATATDALNAALDKLSPSTRTFVKGLLGLADAWSTVKKHVQESFFSRIVDDLDNVKSFLPTIEPLLRRSARAMGNIADQGIRMLTSGPWTRDFELLSHRNARLTRTFGRTVLAVADAFRNITMAAGPFTKEIADGLERGAKSFQKWAREGRKSGEIADMLQTVLRRLREWWTIAKNIGLTIYYLLSASSDFGDYMTKGLIGVTEKWKDYAKEQDKAKSGLKEWLENIKPILLDWKNLLGDLVKGVAKIAADPRNIEHFHDIMQVLRERVLPALIRLLDALAKSDVPERFLSTIASLLDFVTSLQEAGVEEFFAGWLSGVQDVAEAVTVLVHGLEAVLDFLGRIIHVGDGSGSLAKVLGYVAGIGAAIGGAKMLAGKLPFLGAMMMGGAGSRAGGRTSWGMRQTGGAHRAPVGRFAAMGGAAGMVGGIALMAASQSKFAKSIGLSNTAMYTGVGLMFGPYGAAIGATIGAIMDATTHSEKFSAAMETMNKGMETLNVSQIMQGQSDAGSVIADNAAEDKAMGSGVTTDPVKLWARLKVGLQPAKALQATLRDIDGWFGSSFSENNKLKGAALDAQVLTDSLRRAQNQMGLASDGLAGTQKAADYMSAAWSDAGFSADDLQTVLKGGMVTIDGWTYSAQDATDMAKQYIHRVDSGPAKLRDLGEAIYKVNHSLGTNADKAAAAQSALENLTSPMEGYERTSIGFRDSLKNLGEAFHGSNGAFGDKTKTALLDSVDQLKANYAAAVNAGKKGKELRDVWEKGRKKLLDVADAHGADRDQLNKYLNRMGVLRRLPEIKPKVDDSGIKQADRETRKLIRHLKDLFKLQGQFDPANNPMDLGLGGLVPGSDNPLTPGGAETPPVIGGSDGKKSSGVLPINPRLDLGGAGTSTMPGGTKSGGLVRVPRSTRGTGDLTVVVNNPVPERASHSVSSVLKKHGSDSGWAA